MGFGVAPRPDGGLVAPEGEREDLAAQLEALETLDGDEAVHGFELGFQRSGEIEVIVPFADEGNDFEDDSDHGATFGACGVETHFRNRRSSLRIKRSRLANS